MSSLPTTHGERRQVTVMFSDLVSSTELSAQLDPEDVHDIITQYHQTAANAAKKFEGHVSQYLGDGVLILFGYPQAHEHDAERAVLASLALLKNMETLNRELEKKYNRRLAVRVGIHTGEVMIGTKPGDSGNLFGETPNIAARVQSSAEPNSICISASTHRLVSGFFVVDDLGAHVLKGLPDPINLYKVIRASGVRGRLHNASRSTRTVFVGREEERNLLMSKWQLAQKGSGQLVMITGEAGIGKSRLLQQFKSDVGSTPHTWIEGESSPYEQDTPFAPTLDLISNAFQWNSETAPTEKIDQLENAFKMAGMNSDRAVPLLANLFGIEIPAGRFPPLLLSAEQQRTQLLQTLVDWVIGSAKLQPTILVVEDLHFADPSTLEEFLMLSEQIESVPALLIFTSRPRFKPPWPTRVYHSLITLNRLEKESVREMIELLLGKLLSKETLETLIDRTDGIPLFAEELSSAIAESRSSSNLEKQVPSSLQDLLMARLDFLGPVKEIAQICSVIGRDFTYSLLRLIAGVDEQNLELALARLVDSGLVVVKDLSNDAIYTFKHALVQEAAYSTLLKSRRRELHRAVAKALEESFPEIAKARPELIAQHLTQAGEIEPAVDAWQKAGDFAYVRSAYSEAQRHYQKGLEVLANLPETSDRAFIELPIQASLGRTLQLSEGFGGKESFKAFSRARELANQMGNSTQVQIVLLGVWGTLISSSNIHASKEVLRELLRMAQQTENDMMLTWSYEAQAIESYTLGKFSEVPAHFEELVHYYHAEEHTWSPSDPKVTTSIHMSLALWQLGKIEEAREVIRAQAAHAKSISETNMAGSYLGACSLALVMSDGDWLAEKSTALSQLAKENNLPNYISWGSIYQGCANILQGNPQTGIDLLTKGIDEYLKTGTYVSLAQYLGILALGYAGIGNYEKAFLTLENAFGAVGEEAMHLHELHRIHGSLLAKTNQREEAEKAFREAIKISQQFGSLSVELRASTELGYLLLDSGDSDSARALVAPLYAKFTNGFDTPDLQAAKQLLDKLS